MKKMLLGATLIIGYVCHAQTLPSENVTTSNNRTRAPFKFPKNLHEACYNGDIAAVERFLEQGNKPTELGGDDGKTPLHYLFTNMGVGVERPEDDPYNKKTILVVMQIHHLLQKHTRKDLMAIKDQYGQTAKEALFYEVRHWCRYSQDHSICKQYAELLHLLLQKDVI